MSYNYQAILYIVWFIPPLIDQIIKKMALIISVKLITFTRDIVNDISKIAYKDISTNFH